MTTKSKPNFLLAAGLTIQPQADTTKRPRVEILAYTGGVMSVPDFGPVIVDLTGLQTPDAVPLLSDHAAQLDCVVGVGRPTIQAGRLTIAGTLGNGERAAQILDLFGQGVPLGASVGVEPLESRMIRPGETVSVNGRQIKIDRVTTLVARGRLREISIVPVPADADTAVSIAARANPNLLKGKNTMSTDQQNLAPATPTNDAAEIVALWKGTTWHDKRHREAAEGDFLRACAGEINFSDFRAALGEAVGRDKEGHAIRADRPQAPAAHIPDQRGNPAMVRAAACMMRAGYSAAAGRCFDERTLGTAEKMAREPILEMVRGCLLAEGHQPPADRGEMIRAGFSTISLPVALGAAGEKILMDAYTQAPAAWRNWCKIISVSSFREHGIFRPTFGGNFKPVAPGGELQHGTATEESATIRADTYGKVLSIDRRDLVNDDAGAFGQAANAMGRAAARKLADLTTTELLAGVNVFFTAPRGNLLTDELTHEAVANAVAKIRAQVDADGDCLDIVPKVLLVPPALESLAISICNSDVLGVTDGSPTANSLKGVLTAVVDPRMQNATIPGASETAWAVLAGPGDCLQAVAFLNGREAPVVEALGLQADVNRLGYAWRAFHDFGTSLVDYRAGVFSTGAGS